MTILNTSRPTATDRQVAIIIWRKLVRINQKLQHDRGLIPLYKTGGEVAAMLASMQIKLKLFLKFGAKLEIINLFDKLKSSLQLLLALLDHRLHQLAWVFPINKVLPTRRTYLDTTLLYLRDEVLRQIDLTTDILGAIRLAKSGTHMDTPLLRDADPDIARHLDTKRIQEVIKVLVDERSKVEQLEYHIMFTGTMKAGKTTAINAIVGQDVLPTRSEAMTTLPTLIKNNPNNKEPVLSIRQALRLNQFLEKIRLGEIPMPKEKVAALNGGVGDAYNSIKNGDRIPEKPITGAKEIAKVLSLLNDALRIAELSEVGDSLMEIFESGEDLPIVEVAFSPMSGLIDDSANHGRLVLVDSPGPNEAKHSSRLIKIVKDQLERCSAMVIVSNYTVKDGSDEEGMRQILEEYVTSNPEQNILFVNRYDEAVASDPQPEKILQSRAKLYDKIAANRIFLVAANKALLANLAQRDLDTLGIVQSRKDDFTDVAFGDDYDSEAEEYKDPQKWRNAVTKVWNKSFFASIPVTNKKGRAAVSDEPTPMSCIKEAARQADRLCLFASLHTLDTQNKLVNTFLSIRGRLNDDELVSLKEELNSLGNDLDELSLGKDKLDIEMQELLQGLSDMIEEQRSNLEGYAKNEINRVFRQKQAISDEEQPMKRHSPRGRIANFINTITKFIGENIKHPDSLDKLKNSDALPTIELPDGNGHVSNATFYSKDEALRFQEKLDASMTSFIKGIEIQCTAKVINAVSAAEETIKHLVENGLQITLQKAATRLGHEFSGKISHEQVNLNAIAQVGTGQRIKPSKHTYKEDIRVNAAGFWADVRRDASSFVNWLGGDTDWGKKTATVTHNYFELDASDLLDVHVTRLNQFQSILKEEVDAYIKKHVVSAVDVYFNAVVEYLEAYKNEISDVLADHKLSLEERTALRQKVLELRERVEQVLGDIVEAGELLSGKKEMAN